MPRFWRLTKELFLNAFIALLPRHLLEKGRDGQGPSILTFIIQKAKTVWETADRLVEDETSRLPEQYSKDYDEKRLGLTRDNYYMGLHRSPPCWDDDSREPIEFLRTFQKYCVEFGGGGGL